MAKQYVRIHDAIDAELRKLQGSLIASFLVDVSYNTVVNMVLLSGLLAAEKLEEEDWAAVKQYWLEEEPEAAAKVVGGKAKLVIGGLKAAN